MATQERRTEVRVVEILMEIQALAREACMLTDPPPARGVVVDFKRRKAV